MSTANNNNSDQGVAITRASKALPRGINRIALCFDGATNEPSEPRQTMRMMCRTKSIRTLGGIDANEQYADQ